MRRQLPCLSMVLANCDDCARACLCVQSPQRRRTAKTSKRVRSSSSSLTCSRLRFRNPFRKIVTSRAEIACGVRAASGTRRDTVTDTCGAGIYSRTKSHPSTPRERADTSEASRRRPSASRRGAHRGTREMRQQAMTELTLALLARCSPLSVPVGCALPDTFRLLPSCFHHAPARRQAARQRHPSMRLDAFSVQNAGVCTQRWWV